MKKLLLLSLLSYILLFYPLLANSYMGKIEPYKSITIKSQASGIVAYVNTKAKNRFIKNDLLVKLDTTDIDIEINSLRKDVNNQQKIYNIQNSRFKQKSKLSTVSQFEKQQDELNMRNALRSLYSTKKQYDLTLRKKAKMQFRIKNRYVGDIYVNKGELVNVGMTIAGIYDISQSKITLFIRKEDIDGIKEKNIYINGALSDYKIVHLSTITDKTYISSYRVEIAAINSDKSRLFGEVVKVEFK